MSRGFKDETRFHGVTNTTLAKELNISEDRMTAMNNSIESAPVGRLVDSCDYMGADPMDIISGLSDNRFVYDGVDKFGTQFCDTRKKLLALQDADDANEPANKLFTAVYRRPLIYISGSCACGKITLAENLLGKKFRFLGSPISRTYTHLLIMSESCSETEYNYPVGEYPYLIDDRELIPRLLTDSKHTGTSAKLKPIISDGMDSCARNYLVYSNSSLLNTVNLICSNQNNTIPDDETAIADAENEAEIIGLADIMIIMLGNDEYNRTKLVQLINCGWERWRYSLSEHMIFVVSKCDRYTINEAEEIKLAYEKLIRVLIEQTLPEMNKQGKALLDEIPNMVFLYSSIRKMDNPKNKFDASYNWGFNQKLHQMLTDITDDDIRRSLLSRQLTALRTLCSTNTIVSNNDILKAKMEIQSIIATSEKDFRNRFSQLYDGIICTEHITEIIASKELSRKREDRLDLISAINTELAAAVNKAILESLDNVKKMLLRVEKYLKNEAVFQLLAETINAAFNNSDLQTSKTGKADKKKEAVSTAQIAGMVISHMDVFSVAGILPIAAGGAGIAVVSYYAQTNYEKNMAKKVVSAYNSLIVRDNLSNRIAAMYFKELKERLLAIIDNSAAKKDDKSLYYIDRLLNEAM